MIFSAITTYEGSLFAKSAFLIFFASFSLIITMFYQPFILREFNTLEFYSTLSALITIFSGSLYVSDVNDYLKALCFFVIVLVNAAFSLRWILSMFEIIFNLHFNFFKKYFPKFSQKYISIYSTVAGNQTSLKRNNSKVTFTIPKKLLNP